MTTPSPTSTPTDTRPATRLLIVDDEPDVRAAMARVFERAGFAVRLAASADEAIASLRTAPVDLLITDMIMPGLNGADLIRAIKRDFPAIRVVAISGGGNFWPQGYKPEAITTSAYLAAAEKAGADGAISKPFEILELLDVVRSVLAKRDPGP